ncbi:MAG: transposase [Lacunisphaera sp.]
MKPEDFARQFRDAVVQQNAAIYKDLFTSTPINSASDPYWKRALALHAALTPEQRAVLFEIMRQTMVDTVSNVFAILDGVSSLDGCKEDFVLASKTDPQKINGNLQDLFLEIEERDRS